VTTTSQREGRLGWRSVLQPTSGTDGNPIDGSNLTRKAANLFLWANFGRIHDSVATSGLEWSDREEVGLVKRHGATEFASAPVPHCHEKVIGVPSHRVRYEEVNGPG
jgi:hypothetical protein